VSERGPRSLLAALALLVLTAGCGKDPFGSPVRVKTHGYRARLTEKSKGTVTGEWELAVRGGDRRKAPLPGQAGHVLVWKGGERKLLDLDPASRTYTERPMGSLDDAAPGHPLETGFSEKEEARRRGIEAYHRESDTVFAGHVCWIWRFDDKEDDSQSPSTSYWVAPDLDMLLLRVVREVPKKDGLEAVSSSDLTDVRLGADPSLFTPQDFRKVESR
jgi:hypothetical protein